MGPLLDACDRHHLMPLLTVCDGNCGADVCCYWSGAPRTHESRLEMRGILADMMQSHVHEKEWLDLFDVLLGPDWQTLSREQARIADRASGASPEGPRASEAAGAHQASGAGASEDMRHAIRWAAGIGGKDGAVDDFEVEELIMALPEEKQTLWLERWRKHMAEEPSPSSLPSKVALRRPKRRYRSYVLQRSMKLAQEFLRTYPKKPGKKNRKRGSMDTFLASKGWDTSKATKDHSHGLSSSWRKTPS